MEYPTRDDIMKNIGEKVLYYRKTKGFSQADLCYSAEIDISTLSRIERGQLNATLDTYYKISKILEIELYQLFIK